MKQSNPAQKLTRTFRCSISEKWKNLPAEEKEKYKPVHKPAEESVQSEEPKEVFSIFCRCSPDRFKATVSKFSEAKKAACEALGFGVLIKMGGRRLRKSMVRYLVECVDPIKREIKIHGCTFKLVSNDFARVMGLKNAGRKFPVYGLPDLKGHRELMEIVNQFCGPDRKSKMMAVSDLENYLRDEKTPVNDKFKRVFTLYTMSTMLTPNAGIKIPQKWLLPLTYINAIASYNWCEHAFELLMNGIKQFQKIPKDQSSSKLEDCPEDRRTYISGCVLFLQLFYFDCVVSPENYVDRSMYPVEAWGDTAADKLLQYSWRKGGLFSDDIVVRRPGGPLSAGAGAGAGSENDEEWKQRVVKLEEGLKEYRQQNASNSEKLGLILNMVQQIAQNQPQPQPQQQQPPRSEPAGDALEKEVGDAPEKEVKKTRKRK